MKKETDISRLMSHHKLDLSHYAQKEDVLFYSAKDKGVAFGDCLQRAS